MLPSFSSSKLVASNTRKTRAAGLQNFVTRFETLWGQESKVSSALTEEKRYKVSGCHLRQHRFSEKIAQQIIPGVTQNFNLYCRSAEWKNLLKPSETPTFAKSNRSKRISSAGKKSVNNICREAANATAEVFDELGRWKRKHCRFFYNFIAIAWSFK